MCIIYQIYADFHPGNEGSSCLKSACGCIDTNMCKKCLSIIFKQFFKNKVLKNPTLILLTEGLVDPNPHWKLGMGKLNQTDG